jgi:hypothetical protein
MQMLTFLFAQEYFGGWPKIMMPISVAITIHRKIPQQKSISEKQQNFLGFFT